MKVRTQKDCITITAFLLIGCFVIILVTGCGSKDTALGVAQFDENSHKVSADNNSQNTIQPEEEDAVVANDFSERETISQQTDEQIATSFAECLRTEGINVSDPELNADGTVNMMAFRRSMTNDPNFNFQDSNTRQSIQKCVPLLQNASFTGQSSQEDEIELQDNLLEIAQCLRDAGIDVKDPDMSGDRIQVFQSMLGELDWSRDSLEEAMSQCAEAIFGNDRRGGSGRPPGR
jgi:hypothetical protein